VDAAGAATSFEQSENLRYFKQVTQQFGLADSAAIIYENGEQIHGMGEDALSAIADDAALLINISGHLSYAPIMKRIGRKAYIDIDPGFTQFWHEQGNAGARLNGHDFYYTIAENIGSADCLIPSAGLAWRTIRQPVVIEDWPVVTPPATFRFTTIASWRGTFGAIEHGGRRYGAKAHEFRKFIGLPRRSRHHFEIALDIHAGDAADASALRDNGWKLVNPKQVAATPQAFRDYVGGSSAEFSVAQGVYVNTHSGWFSDRTIRYLASGRPALVQDTGFSGDIAQGRGLVPFTSFEEAVDGANRIAADFEAHSRAARELAAERFNSDVVLSKLLNEVGVI
jgi:hypothetical protein